MVKRFLCLLLFFCLLMSVFTACGGKGDKEPGSEEESESVTTQEPDSVGDKPTPIMSNFGGYEFKVLTRSGSLASDDITGEVGGGKMSNATYRRNLILERKYNFKIVEDRVDSSKTIAQTAGEAGEYAYDMWCIRMADIPGLALKGYLHNLNKVDGLNLKASYYDQKTIDAVSFAERLFFVTGDMLYMDDLAISCMVFNPDLWDELDCYFAYYKDIYELVEDGEWTLEALRTIASLGTKDLNKDGVLDKNDQWGCAYANGDIFAMSVALGNSVIKKDDDDIFYLNQSEKLVTDLTNIFDFFNSDSCIADLSYMTGTSLFKFLPMNNLVSTIVPGNVPYGIIPAPKADENSEYYSYVSAHSSNCINICSTVPDVNKTANIIELISYESQSTNAPMFTEFLFSNVYAHEQDAKMVKILIDTRAYENAYTWGVGSIYNTLRDLKKTGGRDVIAKTLADSKSSVDASVQTKLEALNQLD